METQMVAAKQKTKKGSVLDAFKRNTCDRGTETTILILSNEDTTAAAGLGEEVPTGSIPKKEGTL